MSREISRRSFFVGRPSLCPNIAFICAARSSVRISSSREKRQRGVDQLAYVRSPVERFGSYRIREIWSPAYRADGDALSAAVANRLLEDAQSSILGDWVRQGGTAVISFFSGIVDASVRVRLGGYPGAFRDVLGVLQRFGLVGIG